MITNQSLKGCCAGVVFAADQGTSKLRTSKLVDQGIGICWHYGPRINILRNCITRKHRNKGIKELRNYR